MTQGYPETGNTSTNIFFLPQQSNKRSSPMGTASAHLPGIVALPVLAVLAASPAAAADLPAYTIAYTITVQNDGTAHWQVEYRTPLSTDADAAAFEEYAATIDTAGLPQFRQLIERSASQATIANSRPMEVTDFKGTADIQTSPTGRLGVVLYSFTWKGFAESGPGLTIGDAFAGGMYLPRDAMLTIRYPSGYTVMSAEPAPDRTGDGLTWYGVRSFGIGKPLVVLHNEPFPLTMLLAAAGVLLVVIGGAWLVLRRNRVQETRQDHDDPDEAEPAGPAPSLSDAEIHSLEEQITGLIRSAGGEMYQSEIVKGLGLPKSTISSALNDMHARGRIIKVKKGRENLIRLA